MAKKKILIVDDDRDIRVGLNARLRAAGYDTAFAADGIGAVGMARKEMPDLILLDIGLPAGDGFVVLDRLQDLAELSTIPVVVLTARDPVPSKQKALDAGAVAFFQKPANNAELLGAMWRILGEPQEVAGAPGV